MPIQQLLPIKKKRKSGRFKKGKTEKITDHNVGAYFNDFFK